MIKHSNIPGHERIQKKVEVSLRYLKKQKSRYKDGGPDEIPIDRSFYDFLVARWGGETSPDGNESVYVATWTELRWAYVKNT